jgi:hypothetical protein
LEESAALNSFPSGHAAGVVHVLDTLTEKGQLQLPTLTTEELAALGALDASPLRDVTALKWWSELAEEVRAALQASACAG